MVKGGLPPPPHPPTHKAHGLTVPFATGRVARQCVAGHDQT
jgi:hypothetical protein